MGDRRRKELPERDVWWGMDQIVNRDTVIGLNGGKGGSARPLGNKVFREEKK